MKTHSLLGSLLLSLGLAVSSAYAVNRTVAIKAPATAAPGAAVQVIVSATTDAGDAEQIGFFHAEYSNDGGVTWSPHYRNSVGSKTTQTIDFKAGSAGTKSLVRVRIAFRGGKAGDVDYNGKPIDWDKTWDKWATPPAKSVTIEVKAP